MSVPSKTPAERQLEQKRWLKRLAAERKAGWMIAVRPRSLDGAVAIETKREVIHLEDGIVTRVHGIDGSAADTSASPLVGMRVAGWANEVGELHPEYVPGSRAVLWRRGEGGLEVSLALTSRVRCYVIVRRAVTGSVTALARGVERERRGAKPRSGIHRAAVRAPAAAPVSQPSR